MPASPPTRPSPPSRARHRLAPAALAIALATLAHAPAQTANQAPTALAGHAIPAPTVDATLNARAARAWSWREASTHRLLLERDVRIDVAGHHFLADRAAIWVEPANTDHQVAIYLDNARDPAGASASAHRARRLLVTARLTNPPTLAADLFTQARPAPSTFLDDADARLAAYLAQLTAPEPATAPPTTPSPIPQTPVPAATTTSPPAPTTRPAQPSPAAATIPVPDWAHVQVPPDLTPPPDPTRPPAERSPLRTEGVFTFSSAGSVRRVLADADAPDAATHAIIADQGIIAQYESTELRTIVELRAERGVVFLASTDADPIALTTADIASVYLEGDVQVTTPDYSMRARRVLVDVQNERAILVDAVFWTFDADKGMPLYLRAEEVRQESALQWSAQNVRLSNVAFAQPHFAIGVESITLSGRPSASAPAGIAGVGAMEDIKVTARGLTFRAADVPLAAIARANGDIRPSPLTRFEVGSKDGDAVVRTQWDLYAILGRDASPGNNAELLLDAYFDRGPAIGADLDWRSPDLDGSLFAYYIHDDGTDNLTSGAEIDHDQDDRYILLAEQAWKLNQKWSIFTDLAYISDETFVDAFFEDDAESRREFSSAIWARRLHEQEAVFLEARVALNDFVSSEYLFQSLGYHTQRLPELSAFSIGRPLFNDAVSYYAEMRAGLLDLSFSDPTLRRLGFDTLSRAQAAAGLTPDDSIADLLDAAGVPDDRVARFDTRHELELPLSDGPLNVVPFAAARFTAYDSDFDAYAEADDNYRLWGSLGVRASTTFIRVNESARSKLFAIDGIRHIVEPQLTAWTAGATIDQRDLPVFDDDVESLADGSTLRLGLRNTFQTRRGPDRRSTDWIVLDTDLVWASDHVEQESPFFTFIDSRPENGTLGEFFDFKGRMRLTDALSLVGGHQIDLDSGEPTQSSVGVELDHGAGFRSYAELRERDPIDQRTVNAGAAWELGLKHALALDFRYDIDASEAQDVRIAYTRRFPQWTFRAGFAFDGIGDTVGLAFTLSPVGVSGETRLRDFRSNDDVFATPIADTPRPAQDRARTLR